jgi:hypothetical protein
MCKRIFLAFLLPLAFASSAQVAAIDTLATLPKTLNEISGIIHTPRGNFWCINDSGNKPELYQIDAQGNVLKTVLISNAYNTDWEELATDGKGRIFIGDFGNNRNDRTELKVYIVLEDDVLKNDAVEAAEIKFVYADQKQFPPEEKDHNYDMEAMVFYRDNLYLFTKNRTKPFTGYTYLYKLHVAAGEQVAQRVDSLYLGAGPRELYQITGSEISPDGNLLALLSYDKFYLIHDFPFNDLFGGRIEQVETALSQKESIAFLNDTTLLLADERSVLGGGYLYATSIAAHRKKNSEVRKHEVRIPEKQFADTLAVEVETELRGKIYYEFFNGEGERVNYGVVGTFDRGKHSFELTPRPFLNGTYLLNIQVGSRPHAFFVYRYTDVDWDEVKAEFEEHRQDVQNRQMSDPER